MYVVVGLGNPGRKYEHTRHNVGFDIVDVLAQRNNITLARLRCKAVVGEGAIAGQRVALALPQTYMNLSGESVVQLVNWYKPERDQLIVCFDDVDLPRANCASAPRLRRHPQRHAQHHLPPRPRRLPAPARGHRPPAEGWDLKDYVLTGYRTPAERQTMFDAFVAAAETVERLIAGGNDAARARVAEYNNG